MRPGIILLLLSVLAAPLAAQDEDARTQLMQQRREQLKLKWEAQFRAADADNSRSLSREEVRDGGLPGSLLRQFETIDTDHDGGLRPEELWAVYERRLAAQRRVPGRPQ